MIYDMIGRMLQKIRVDQTRALCTCIPQVAQSGLVAKHEENDDNPTNNITSIKRKLEVTK